MRYGLILKLFLDRSPTFTTYDTLSELCLYPFNYNFIFKFIFFICNDYLDDICSRMLLWFSFLYSSVSSEWQLLRFRSPPFTLRSKLFVNLSLAWVIGLIFDFL